MKEKLQKIGSFIRKNFNFLLFILIIISFDLLFIYSKNNDKFVNPTNGIYVILAISNILLILLYSFVFYKLEKIALEKLYLIIVLPIGMILLLLFPPSTIPDENSHLLRALEISQGHLISAKKDGTQGRYFDSNIEKIIFAQNYKLVSEVKNLKKSGKKSFYSFSNTSLYAFVCYIPQSMGVLFAKIFDLPFIFYTYFGRLLNFFVFILLSYNAIKFIPYKKMTLFFILLFPMVIQEAVSLSPDALTISMTAFFVSYVMHLKIRKQEIKKSEIAILFFSSIVLSLCKIVYLPLCFLVFLISKNCFRTLKRKNMILITIMIVAVIINLLWLSFSSRFLPSVPNLNSSMQLHYILCNIPKYIGVVSKTFFNYYQDYIYSSVGIFLGNFEVQLSKFPIDALLILFIIVLLFDNNEVKKKDKLNLIESSYVFMTIFAIIILINTSLYIQWTPLKNDVVLGIQGRYFIPIYIPLMFLFSKYSFSPKVNFDNKYIFLFLVTINVYAATAVFYQFV